MKAAQMNGYGPVENFKIVDIPVPEPGPDDVLIKVAYAGLRWGDIMARNGIPVKRHTGDWVPGQEVAGTVEKVGRNVSGYKPGDRVASLPSDGGYAEYCATPYNTVSPIPDGVPMEKMLIYLINMPVAYMLMYPWGEIQPNETVLLHAAAGGVGLLALQVIKACGDNNTVIAIAGTDEKLEVCKSKGADFCINYKEKDYGTEVREMMAGRGVDIALNSVGGNTLGLDPGLIRPLGRWIIFGSSGGNAKIDIYRFAYSSITIKPFSIIPFIGTPTFQKARDFTDEWVKTRPLDSPHIYPLEDIADMQKAMEEGRTWGKIVFSVQT